MRSKIKDLFYVPKVFSILLVIWFLGVGEAQPFPSILSKLDERLSRIDPVGKVFDPVEEAVPGLELQGSLRFRPRIDLHGKSNSVGPGVKKRYNWSMFEWLAEVGIDYEISRDLRVVNIYNFLYDGFFDWSTNGIDWDKEPYRSTRRIRKYYRTTDRILRELYLDWYIGDWWLRIGKQQLAWGKMRGKYIDIINPSHDWSGGFGFDTSSNYEWTRVPTWMFNTTYYFGENSLQFLWIPDFEPNTPIPAARNGNPFGAITPLPSTSSETRQVGPADKPSSNFRNHEFGINFNTFWNRWDISLFYFYHWDDRPTTFRRGFVLKGEVDSRTGDLAAKDTYYVERKHTRLHSFGMASDVNWFALGRTWAGRIEGNYTLNDYASQVGQPTWMVGVAKRNWLSTAYSLSGKFFRGELDTTLQLVYIRTFGWDSRLRGAKSGSDRRDYFLTAMSLRKEFAFINRRLSMGLVHFYREDGDMKQQFNVTFKFSDYLKLLTRYYWFAGNSNDSWGQNDDKDMLHFEMKYEF
ncbi:MAG: hypothetical protein QF619_07095 [Candidatus Binatia bacterium]|nr:hypothetical protein [Candidatus Binatia bacterium]